MARAEGRTHKVSGRERDLLADRIPLSPTLEKQGPVPEVPCPYFQDGVLKAPFPVAHLPARRGASHSPMGRKDWGRVGWGPSSYILSHG